MVSDPMLLGLEAVPARRAHCSGKVLALVSLLMGLAACAMLMSQTGGQAVMPTNLVAVMQPVPMRVVKTHIRQAEARTSVAAAAALRRAPLSGVSAALPIYTSAARFAVQDGTQAGCRGNSICVRAVGVFFGTQSGKTEEVAAMIASEAGVEADDIGNLESADPLKDYDGLIVGAPTWNTGADEQRSGTVWDDYLDNLKAMDLGGKPVAVFGSGDSIGYGDNYCDAIEELHNTFQAAGAKMLGYVDASGYQHTESKSVKGGKFLGLATDQDNEDDMTEARVKAWVAQIKSEGMPLN